MKKFTLFFFMVLLHALVHSQSLQVGGLETLRPFEPLFREVLERAGFKPSFSYYPQARVMLLLENGSIDANLLLSEGGISSVKGAIRIPLVLSETQYLAVALSSSVQVKTLGDLAKYHVGIERGNTIHQSLASGARELTETADQREQFRMLKAKRFDLAISTRSLVSTLVKEIDLKEWYIQEPPLRTVPLYFSISKKNAAYEASITKAFQKALDSGYWKTEYSKILASLNM